MLVRTVALCLTILLSTGCTTMRSTDPERTATEQLLLSIAADKAAESLVLNIPAGTRVFVEAVNFEGYDSKYAIGAIRDHVLRQGLRLTDDKAQAESIVEIRSGALSVDQQATLIGIPKFDLPIPFAGDFTFPEIALYKSETQQGVAKFAATSYDAKEGRFISSARPEAASSYQEKTVLLFFISWSDDNLRRPEN